MKKALKSLLFATFAAGGVLLCIGAPGAPIALNTSNPTKPPKLFVGSGHSIRSMDDAAVDDDETQQLDTIFSATTKKALALSGGEAKGGQLRGIENDLRNQLESFLASHPNSAWAPGIHMSLGHGSQLRSSYMEAMNHYRQAWAALKSSTNATAQLMGNSASGSLAKLMVLTGRTDEFDALKTEARQLLKGKVGGSEWAWAEEMRAWIKKSPNESYKCGLYCLDQLGRMTDPGKYVPKNILETESSTNGFTLAELMRLGAKAGLHIRAALLSPAEFTNLPVPAVVHLRSDHFVVVREKRGAFYNVYDPVAYGPKWLTATEVAKEATGAIIVRDAIPLSTLALLSALDLTNAETYRGRCHSPLPSDGADGGCCTNEDPSLRCPDCPPTGGGAGAGGAGGAGGSGGCCRFAKAESGMPMLSVSEPYLTPWVTDIPLTYNSAFGPPVALRLAYSQRNQASIVFGYYSHGATMGSGDLGGLWACSWFSYAEMDSSGDTVAVMQPTGGWAVFTFPTGSNNSDINYMHNDWLEKVVVSGNVTALVLHYPDGSNRTYGVSDSSYTVYGGLYYMSSYADPAGNQLTYSYDANFYLTNVTAADGTTFTLQYDSSYDIGEFVTNITTSYGASVSLTHVSAFLEGITDTAGISSQFAYEGTLDELTSLTTPYGTTSINTLHDDFTFDRIINVIRPDGSQEFYGLINSYAGGDWPDFATGQIPTNTPVGTLDADPGGRQERNTFYWNAQQFGPYIATDLNDFNWSIFKQGLIHHWLANTDPTYTHFNTLSLEQAPSPDGTTEGQITWYDYTNKPYGVDYETGSQIMASDAATVMPDGTTWYKHWERTASGLPAQEIEKWVDSGANHFRTNTYVYAPNGIDLVSMTNAIGVQVFSNVFNNYHQVATNYDAINQATTNTYDPTTLQLTSVRRPTGLVTTNIFDSSHRLQKTIDLQINRTNVSGISATS